MNRRTCEMNRGTYQPRSGTFGAVVRRHQFDPQSPIPPIPPTIGYSTFYASAAGSRCRFSKRWLSASPHPSFPPAFQKPDLVGTRPFLCTSLATHDDDWRESGTLEAFVPGWGLPERRDSPAGEKGERIGTFQVSSFFTGEVSVQPYIHSCNMFAPEAGIRAWSRFDDRQEA
ncbi:hypothetical protein P152DRAFT_474181 [Eremomyces bilateralis CBS 781.70]|uniref:Uncharacterized protein n=1 Tax=Eremomyces bilateralis CBS 781.70 TaxID=1392243 RepID=A0A6G1G1K4_9PEZI|nr:uncharacterized protein P152DRAFT_474181 [Eremomyces bilateralis CBS 781.70]KAF1811934.1 hypothetical protein P152DRAFT_474181 [Eremomyces bilateralis CBS 781.70]